MALWKRDNIRTYASLLDPEDLHTVPTQLLAITGGAVIRDSDAVIYFRDATFLVIPRDNYSSGVVAGKDANRISRRR